MPTYASAKVLVVMAIAACGLAILLALTGPAPPSGDAARVFEEGRKKVVAALHSALTRCRSDLPDEQRWAIAAVIRDQAGRYGFDPFFVQALIEVESTCRPTARSRAGALGLIQVKPATARAVAKRAGILWEGRDGLLRPEINLQIGLRYLAELEKRFSDRHLAVAAYNLGPSRVASMEPERARHSRYVRKVMSRYEVLLEEHSEEHS